MPSTANQLTEQAEVILTNLIALSSPVGDSFVIEHIDVIVTLKTAVRLLHEAQEN